MEKIAHNRVVIAFGSNLGDREAHIQQAISLLNARCGSVVQVSSFHSSEAQGFESKNPFLNGCLLLKTNLMPHALLDAVQQIEREIGRVKTKATYEDRPIDLDLIFYENLVVQDARLCLPHPRYLERDFVLIPLAELNLNA
ncbi:MAG: 2-amino-4-hydroxy-6-hydroxymethyldihydropteridine diphosphokinase [Bacteroidota bacterium]|jgi:2-amino-4-hydroxy-6-hydroxymethyldihydropteridine diphosphokinase